MPNEPFWSITIGNIATIMGGILSLAAFWWKTAQRQQQVEDNMMTITGRVTKAELELERMANIGLLPTIAQHERRIADCERLLSELAEMKTDIRWIKGDLERSRRLNP